MYWMAAVPAAMSLGVGLATLCAVLARGPYHNRTQRAGEYGPSERYEEAEELRIGEGGP
jgi:hypothetical protein